MVDLVDTGGSELCGLLGRQQAQAGADVEAVRLLDPRGDLADEVNLPLGRAAGRDHDAERLRLLLGGQLRGFHELGGREQVVAGDFRVGDLRLRAVAAVLWAEAALGIHQEEQLHRVAEVVMPNPPGGREHVEEFDVG